MILELKTIKIINTWYSGIGAVLFIANKYTDSKIAAIGIDPVNGDVTKFLNQKGEWVVVNAIKTLTSINPVITVDSTDPFNPTIGIDLPAVEGSRWQIEGADQIVPKDGKHIPYSIIDNLPTPISAHNDTTGKQGGTTGEYYHLTNDEAIVVSNTSGTNTGDNATNTQYSGLASSKQDSLNVDLNEGITLNSNSIGTVYNTTIANAVLSVAVGGAPAQPASTWKTKSLVQALDTILFPTILASIKTQKSASVTISGATGTLETGTTVSRTLTATFNAGAIFNGDGTTNPNSLVGVATEYTFTGTNISSTSQVGNTLAVSNIIANGTNNWAVTVAYGAGTGVYYDNKGNIGSNLNSSRSGGTVVSGASSPAVTGVYPQWYGVSSNAAIDTYGECSGLAKQISNGTAFSAAFSPTAQYVYFITRNSAGFIKDGNPYTQSISALNVEDGESEFYKKSFIITLLDGSTTTLYSYRTRTTKILTSFIYSIT